LEFGITAGILRIMKKKDSQGFQNSWDLSLLYKNEKDPRIEKDLLLIERICSNFEKKYKNKNYISDVKRLFVALKDYEKLRKNISGRKPWWYFALRMDLNSDDSPANAMATRFDQRITKATNKVTFFDLVIAKIPKSKQKTFLSQPDLKPYAYFLKKIFDNAQYFLSEKEEQIIDLLSQTSYTMWVDGQEKVLTQKTVEHKGEKMPISKALSILSDLPKHERRELHHKIHQIFQSISQFAEAEINATYNYKKILDERRGYKKPYSSTILGYENNEKNIETLVELVTKYFSLSRRFYKLHAKLLGEKKITLADRNVKIGEIKKKFNFNAAVSIVGKSFAKVGERYQNFLLHFLKNRQIDVYPKGGKRGGAYCWGMRGLPTFVLLNHTDDIRSVETLAHEMGHAIHTELSKTQPVLYERYTISVAETASTFFEQVVMSDIENYLSEKEKIILLHNRIMGDVSTIFRQVACFNFELELHNKIRNEGQVSRESIAVLMKKHLQSYLGKSVEVTKEDGYFFVNWSHIRRFFYVYSYAYGQIISRALFENWKQDKNYEKKIFQFLSAGGSVSPEDIFKKAGIDTSDPRFFESGLKSIEKDIEKLEKLAS